MDFALDEQQEMVRDMVRSFAEERIRPGAIARDQSGEFPAEIFEEMAELGLLGMFVPEEYGGAGVDDLSYLMAVEELAAGIPAFKLFQQVGLVKSGGEARRLINQGGAYLNGQRISVFDQVINDNDISEMEIVLRAGKKRFHIILIKG